MKKNVLLICGGGSSEHEISLRSSQYIREQLINNPKVDLFHVEIEKSGARTLLDTKERCELRKDGLLVINPDSSTQKVVKLDYAIPCLHGYPGETGDIQSLFTMMGLPYLGCNAESSIICFNKVSAKLWFSALGIPNTPYIFLNSIDDLDKALIKLKEWKTIFIKASNQGSSVGCYKITSEADLKKFLPEAFKYSDYVLAEKAVIARELEISAYHLDGKVVCTWPGEVICAENTFYSYEEKYSSGSHANTVTKAELDKETAQKIMEYARRAFVGLKLKDLSRIDFFLTKDGEIYLNEINTFPGMTSISMFPKMLTANGDSFKHFLEEKIFR